MCYNLLRGILMKKLFKDPKIHMISCREFYDISDYLHDCKEKNDIENIACQKKFDNDFFLRFQRDTYYKITNNLLIQAIYGFKFLNYGTTPSYCLLDMYVAERNGQDEYECLNQELESLYNETIKHPKSKRCQDEYKKLSNKIKYIKRKMPEYIPRITNNEIDVFNISNDLIDDLYKTQDENLIDKYVVLDLETNGVRKVNDDILSLTIYDPVNGIAWNRFLPLELQPIVLNSYIHGITNDVVKDKVALSQKEFDYVVEFFKLKDKTILTYSGGNFDYDFLVNYFKRHNLSGLENLKFQNIKDLIASNGSGNISKDNLCKIFKIENIKSIHSGLNDCILEWKLFEKIYKNNILIINNGVFEYSPNYVIPVSYLLSYKNLRDIANIELPILDYTHEKVYELEFPTDLVKKIKKFPTNITGMQIEHIINSLLKVKECDNSSFLISNKKQLKQLGILGQVYHEVKVTKNKDGTFNAINDNEEDKKLIDEINAVSKSIKENIGDLIDYINKNIFKNGNILSQELVFSENRKVFACCDLSDKNNVLEIKTFDIFSYDITANKIVTQLFYQSNNRDTYTLSCIYGHNKLGYLNSVRIVIDKVNIFERNNDIV